MADPFSLFASAITVIGAALKTSEVTRDFIKGIRGAPEAVTSLSSDVTALREVLRTLEELLSNRECPWNAALIRMTPKLQQPLDQCMKALDNVNRELKPYVKIVGGESGSQWRTYVRWRYQKKDVHSLRRNLESSQYVLGFAVQVAHLAISTEEFGNMKRLLKEGFELERMSTADSEFQGSDAQQTDYGFAMKRFILDTASISYEPPPSMRLPEDDMSSRGSYDTGVQVSEALEVDSIDELFQAFLHEVEVEERERSLHREGRHPQKESPDQATVARTGEKWRTIFRKTIVSPALSFMGYRIRRRPKRQQQGSSFEASLAAV